MEISRGHLVRHNPRVLGSSLMTNHVYFIVITNAPGSLAVTVRLARSEFHITKGCGPGWLLPAAFAAILRVLMLLWSWIPDICDPFQAFAVLRNVAIAAANPFREGRRGTGALTSRQIRFFPRASRWRRSRRPIRTTVDSEILRRSIANSSTLRKGLQGHTQESAPSFPATKRKTAASRFNLRRELHATCHAEPGSLGGEIANELIANSMFRPL